VTFLRKSRRLSLSFLRFFAINASVVNDALALGPAGKLIGHDIP